jgi:GT2 family glycosyltransferase
MGRGECQIIKRDCFLKIGGYNEKIFAGEDYDLYKRLGKLGRIRFLKNIIVYESPRRYREIGYLRVFWNWTINSVWITLFNKSFSNDWKGIR